MSELRKISFAVLEQYFSDTSYGAWVCLSVSVISDLLNLLRLVKSVLINLKRFTDFRMAAVKIEWEKSTPANSTASLWAI